MRLQQHLDSTRRPFTRALSTVLLAFIIFGTTVEAAHTHGNLPTSKSISTAAQFSDPANDSNLNTNAPGCGECLICQLQQHFQATAISAPVDNGPVPITVRSIQTHAVPATSRVVVTRIGRAPPQISC